MKIVRHIGLKLDKNPYLDSEYFKLRKLRQKALKLSGWYKTRWDKPKGRVMCRNAGIIRSECHRNRNKLLPGY
jgi:RNA-directed DNA polymerase